MTKSSIKKVFYLSILFLLMLTALFAYPPLDDDFLTAPGNKIYADNGNVVLITGINWFGFKTVELMVHGLCSCCWKDVTIEVAGPGFNVIRFPLGVRVVNSWRTGSPLMPSQIEHNPISGFSGLNSLRIFDLRLDMGQAGLKVLPDMHSVYNIDQKAANRKKAKEETALDALLIARDFAGLRKTPGC